MPEKVRDNLLLGGLSPKSWFEKIAPHSKIPNLPDKPLNRPELLNLIQPYRGKKEVDEITIRKLIVSIFAWGGMRISPRSGKLAIDTIKTYEKICLELLNGMSSVSAYDEFYKKKKLGVMRGVGPAFYTKLIFFLGDQTGLIMDQWTAQSTNLLLNAPVIKLRPSKTVHDENSQQVYARYLNFVTELKTALSTDLVSKTEELIFSFPHTHLDVKKRLGEYHKTYSAWRKYVAENS